MSRQKQVDLAKERNTKHIGPKEEPYRKTNGIPILYSFKRCPYAMRARMAIFLTDTICEIREVKLSHKPHQCLRYQRRAPFQSL